MKKIGSKMLLGLGVMTTLTMTGSVVLSCGSSDSNKHKGDPILQGLEGITKEMVTTVIHDNLTPKPDQPAPDAPKNNEFTNLSINGLDDVSITISGWVSNSTQGFIQFSIVSISQSTDKVDGAKFGTIQISGFLSTDQIKLDGITKELLQTVIYDKLNPNHDIYAIVPYYPGILTGITINGVIDVSISIPETSWLRDTAQGSVSFSITSIDKGIAHVNGTKFGTIQIFGFSSTDQAALDGITSSGMVKDAINKKLNPDLTKLVPDAPTDNKLIGISINNLDNVSIIVKDWIKDLVDGIIEFDIVSINKGIAHVDGAQFGTIIIDGFNSRPVHFDKQISFSNTPQCIVYTQSKKFLVGTNIGLWMSSDDGANFNLVKISEGSNTWNINSVLQATDGTIFVSAFDNGLYRSDDDGGTFTKVKQLDSFFGSNITTVYQTSNSNIYVGSASAGLFWAPDTKPTSNFNQVSPLQGSTYITSIYETSGGTIYVGVTGILNNLYMFRGAGTTPKPVTFWGTDKVISKIYQTSNGEVYLGTNHGLYSTTDGGTDFKNVLHLDQAAIGAIMETPSWQAKRRIFIGTVDTNGLWESKNNGIDFEKVNSNILDSIKFQLIYQTPNVDKLFVGGRDNGLWTTSDYGNFGDKK